MKLYFVRAKSAGVVMMAGHYLGGSPREAIDVAKAQHLDGRQTAEKLGLPWLNPNGMDWDAKISHASHANALNKAPA